MLSLQSNNPYPTSYPADPLFRHTYHFHGPWVMCTNGSPHAMCPCQSDGRVIKRAGSAIGWEMMVSKQHLEQYLLKRPTGQSSQGRAECLCKQEGRCSVPPLRDTEKSIQDGKRMPGMSLESLKEGKSGGWSEWMKIKCSGDEATWENGEAPVFHREGGVVGLLGSGGSEDRPLSVSLPQPGHWQENPLCQLSDGTQVSLGLQWEEIKNTGSDPLCINCRFLM